MASILRDWFVMLATTRMTKSFKMVLLRVLLGPDAGLPGTNGRKKVTATLCRSPQAIRSRPQAGISRQTVAVTFFRASLPSPPPASRFITHVPVYDLTAAAGFWGPESQPEEIG
jgi:hypothetical protein